MRRAARNLGVLTTAVTVVALSFYHDRVIAPANPGFVVPLAQRTSWIIGYIALISIVTYAVGLPDAPATKRRTAVLALVATTVGAAGITLFQYMTNSPTMLPRFVVFGTAVLNIPIQVLMNMFFRRGVRRAEDRDRVLLVAGHLEHERLVADLHLEPERSASLGGTLTPEQVLEERSDDLIERTALDCAATLIVLDHHALSDDRIVAQAARLHESGMRIRSLESFYEEWLGKVPLDELERTSLFFDVSELHDAEYSRTKRLLDIVLALVGMVAFILVTPLVLIGNMIGNRGPLIYRQPRVGRAGEVFTIWKFRTMVDAPAGATHGEWTAEDDPRITSFGGLLRKSHLDELPQMINILRGELSMVGPRPEQPHYVAELSAKLPFYNLRHLVRPGLTGWAQVKYGYAGDEADALEKLQYEFFYLRHQDMRFDIRIILRTIRSTIGGRGAGR